MLFIFSVASCLNLRPIFFVKANDPGLRNSPCLCCFLNAPFPCRLLVVLFRVLEFGFFGFNYVSLFSGNPVLIKITLVLADAIVAVAIAVRE